MFQIPDKSLLGESDKYIPWKLLERRSNYAQGLINGSEKQMRENSLCFLLCFKGSKHY